MYSLNAPVPAEADRLVAAYGDRLAAFESVAEELSLVIKRFGRRPPGAVSDLEVLVEELLAEWGPIAARITGFDVFTDPPGGPSPVVYLAVESPGLEALHAALVETFDVVASAIEDEAYVPHVTVARGGDRTALEPLTSARIEPIDWTIDDVWLWDARYERSVRRFSLLSGRGGR